MEKGEGRTDEGEEVMEEGREKEDIGVYPEEEIEEVVRCLQALKKALEQAEHATVQPPLKALPTTAHCFPQSDEDFFSPLVRFMQSRRLLHCLLILLAAPSTNGSPRVFEAVRDLLLFFLSSQEGTTFLSSNPGVMTAMARTLVPPSMDDLAQMDEDDMLTFTDMMDGDGEGDADEDSNTSCTPQNLGLLLTYHLQALQSLDALRKASKLNMSELESAECIGALHTLYSMTLAPIGKCAVTHILSLSDNVLVLLPFIEPRHQRDHDTKLTKSSVSSRYVAVLLLTLMKSSVRVDFLFSCGSKLLSAAEFFKDNSSPLMSDLHNWFSPVKELTSTSSAKVIPGLVTLIKDRLASISCSKPGRACSPIMTAIRLLLCYVTTPPTRKGTKKNHKITQNLVHLFSANCLDTLLAFLNKFSDAVLPVWSQRQSLSISNASILVSLATFALQLLKELQGSLLDSGEYQFRDTRVAQVLLKVHMVLCSAPYFTVAIDAAHELQMLIVQILVMYTKPRDIVPEGEDMPDVSHNCWCLMLKEVFEHTLSSPHCFLSGLMVLSELLPLPLPTHSAQPVSRSNFSYHRKLWGLHLDPFLPSISELVQTFLLSSPNALQQTLRRVCAQLADINTSLATLITQQIISSILVEIEKHLEKEEPEPMNEEGGGANEGEEGGAVKEEKGGTEEQTAEKMAEDEEQTKKPPNSPLLRLLTTCAVLCQQHAVKVALLNLIAQKETPDTKGFSRFIPLLLFLVQRKETLVQHKLCVMTILNALCNMYIGLTAIDMEDTPSEQQLSNCLPGKVKLETITSAVLSHVTSPDQPLATMMLGLKVILSLCQYDVGLLNIYRLIPTHIRGFAYILKRLTEAVRSPSPPPDTISCVSLFLQLLGHLLSSEVTGRVELFDEGEIQPSPPGEDQETSSDSSEKKRDSHYEMQRVGFPRPLLKMIVISESGENLLGNLRDALGMNCKEDTSLFTEFTKIITTLEQEFEGVEPAFEGSSQLEYRSWPPMQKVEAQFEVRNVVSLTVNPPSPDYWMSSPPHDESELEPDPVTRDLSKLASQTCSGLNLEEELKKQQLPSPPRTPPRDRKRKIALTGPEAQKRLKEAIQQRMLLGPKRDLFRLRKQNTSRPPSMHVDDFMASKSGSRGGRGALLHDHSLGSRGRGGPFPYLSQPAGMFMPSMGSGRWLGATMAPGMTYPTRRDVMGSSSMRSSWDTRGIPSAFLSASQLKSSALRNASVYSALQQAYSRASGSGRGPILWPSSSSSSSSRSRDSGHKSSSSSSSRHNIYKRLA